MLSLRSRGAVLLATVLAALLATGPALADATTLSIYDSSSTYRYGGCFNETTEISGSAMTRALQDGKMLQGTGNMTVEMCLGFCGHNDTGAAYKFAGLEYSRECWCGVRLSALSARLDDAACDTPCDGNASVACGGSLKLSVYNLTTTSGKNDAARVNGEAKASLMGLIVGIVAVVGLL
jgi:hypothetical protein